MHRPRYRYRHKRAAAPTSRQELPAKLRREVVYASSRLLRGYPYSRRSRGRSVVGAGPPRNQLKVCAPRTVRRTRLPARTILPMSVRGSVLALPIQWIEPRRRERTRSVVPEVELGLDGLGHARPADLHHDRVGLLAGHPEIVAVGQRIAYRHGFELLRFAARDGMATLTSTSASLISAFVAASRSEMFTW